VGDGIRTNDVRDTGKGYVLIDGGTVSIEVGADGVNADNMIVIRPPAKVDISAHRFPINSDHTLIEEGTLTIR